MKGNFKVFFFMSLRVGGMRSSFATFGGILSAYLGHFREEGWDCRLIRFNMLRTRILRKKERVIVIKG